MKIVNKQLVSEQAITEFWDAVGVGVEDVDPREGINFSPLGNEKQQELLEVCGVGEWVKGGELRQPKCGLIGYGGAAFGGKSYGMLGLASVLGQAWPGIQIAYFRRKYTEMSGPGAVMTDAAEVFRGIAVKRDDGKEWKFKNGTDFYFRHCEHESDVTGYHGAQIDVLMVDEATHFTWHMIDYLLTRSRVSTKNPGMGVIAILCSNPGNIGHGWYMNLFKLERNEIKGWDGRKDSGPKHVLNPNGRWTDVYFIPAYLEDNKEGVKRDPEYEKRLMERDPQTAQALRYGDWEVFSGQVFKEFDVDRHVVKGFDIPTSWPIWRGIDWGYQEPYCCLWLTRDINSGRIYVIREVYQAGLTDKQQAELVALYSPAEERVQMTLADPSMWVTKSRMGVIFSSAMEYAQYGVPLIQADNDRIAGVKRIHGLLADLPDGKPGMQIFENCPNLIRTLPKLSASEANVEDVGARQEDHAYDCLKYATSNVYLFGERKRNVSLGRDPWKDVSKWL